MVEKKIPSIIYPLLFYIFIENIGVGLMIPFIGPLYIDSKSGIFPTNFSVELRQIIYGFMIGMSSLIFFISSPIWGDFSDRYGRRYTLLIGVFCLICGYFICALGVWSKNFIVFIFGQSILGVSAGSSSASTAALCDANAEIKSNNLRYNSIVASLGFLTGPFIGGYMASFSSLNHYQYIMPFIVIGLFSTLNYAWLFFFFKETKLHPFKKTNNTWIKSLSLCLEFFFDARINLIIFVLFISDIGYSVFFNYVGIYLFKAYKMNPVQISNFIMLMVIGYILNVTFIYPLIKKKIRLLKAVKLMLFLASVNFILMVFFHVKWAFIVFSLIVINSIGIKDILLLFYFSEQVEECEQGWLMGALGSVNSLSTIFAGLIIGFLSHYFIQIPFFCCGIFCLISLIIMIAVNDSRFI